MFSSKNKILEKQIKDLKISLSNFKIKTEIKIEELKEQVKAIQKDLSEKDGVISMLQKSISSLDSENAKLREENKNLKESNTQIHKEFDNAIENMQKSNSEVLRLKALINKDSSNSSKPPSKNGFKKIVNQREKSSLETGGQKGHKGHRISLPNNVDELVENGTAEKLLVDYTNGDEDYTSKWVIDIKVTTIFTEYRFPKGMQIPKQMQNEVTYGESIKAITVLLSNEGMLSMNRLSSFISDITYDTIKLSEGTITNILNNFSNLLNPELEKIKENLLNGRVINVDDSPLSSAERIVYKENSDKTTFEYAKGTSFFITIRTHSNDTSTFYTINPKKDLKGIVRDDILTKYTGILVHDHEKKFYNFAMYHATCGSHLVRELKGLYELLLCIWAEKMLVFMLEMNAHKENDLQNDVLVCDPDVLTEFMDRYDILISEGLNELNNMDKKHLGYKELRTMVNRLINYKNEYTLFIVDYEVPFTNNLSERDLRPSKTKLKVSGCFRSYAGAVNYARTRSFTSTVKKRSMGLYVSICKVLKGTSVLS